jgi:hypothetical protein
VAKFGAQSRDDRVVAVHPHDQHAAGPLREGAAGRSHPQQSAHQQQRERASGAVQRGY